MRPWLQLLFAAVVAAEWPHYDSGWQGPAEGCVGAQEANQLSAQCTLPSGNLTLSVNRAASWMSIVCEQDSSFTCEELQEARQLIADYVTLKSSQTDRTVDRFEVKNCILPPESLRCPLSLFGGGDAVLLRLTDVRGEVRALHVEGMKAVEKFRIIYGRGENVTTMPYDILSRLPALRSFSLKKGALVLQPDPEGPPLPQLKMLELAEGQLLRIPRGAFRKTPHVETLLLWGNQIEDIHEDAFVGLSRAVNVSLNSNRLSSLPPDVLRPLSSLGQIDLYNNRLRTLPRDLFRGLAHLETVLIFDNKAPLSLEDGLFSNLPSLGYVKLESSSIRTLPGDLFRNSTKLTHLSLSGNNITTLPEDLLRDVKLKTLSLRGNKLEHWPPEVLSAQNRLEDLDLSGNLLARLSEELFYHTKQLRKLHLSGNRLEVIANSSFNKLVQLKELHLAGNRIQDLDSATFDGLGASLEVLSLAGNDMTISRERNTRPLVPQELYAQYALDGGAGGALPGEAGVEYYSPLRGLRALVELDLSRNRVSVMCDDWRALPALRSLNLAYNSFAELTDIDMYFTSGAEVDLRHNRLAYFQVNQYPAPSADSAHLIPTFRLDYNPFRCDCRMYQFLNVSKGRLPSTRVRIDQASCAQPPELNRVPLTGLSPDQLTCNSTDCPENCTCIVRPSRAQLDINCQTLPPSLLPKIEGFATQLRLHQITNISQLTADVGYVDLSALNLTEPPRMTSCVEIDLSGNLLSGVPIDLLKQKCLIHLAGNPIDCSCGKRGDLEFLREHRRLLRDYGNLTCHDRLSVSGVDVRRLCAARDAAAAAGAVALLALAAALLTAAAYRYRTEVRIVLRKFGLWCWEDDADDKPYDAFVAFAHQDQRFVVEQLVPRLEGGRRALRLCLHYRDWVVGEFIPTQIARSVEISRRTILVLSAHSLHSEWTQLEFQAAHARRTLIVLLMDDLAPEKTLDPKLKAYVALNTYVRRDDPLVYDRLKDAVLSRRTPLAGLAGRKPTALDVHLNGAGELVNRALAAPDKA